MSLYSDLILRDQPVAYWQMGEANGNIADSTANGNTGVAHGTLTYGQSGPIVSGGTAIKFDGSTAYFQAANAASLRITGDLSMEAWINIAVPTNVFFLDKANNNVAAPYEFQYTGSVLRARRGNGITDGTLDSVHGLGTGAWHHAVWTMAGQAVVIYIDGKIDITGTITATVGDTGLPLFIGCRGNAAPVNPLNGQLAHVAIYNYALTAAQVINHYNAGVRAFRLTSSLSRGPIFGPNRGALRVAQAGVA